MIDIHARRGKLICVNSILVREITISEFFFTPMMREREREYMYKCMHYKDTCSPSS